jgi:hypothetical protein
MRIKVCDGAPGCGTFFRDGGDGVALILGTLDQPPPARSATVADALAWYKETKGDAVTSVHATPEAARDALRTRLHDPNARTTLALRDSFSGWERSGATARGGKPLFVEVGDVRVHQIFFDDHILPDDAHIVDARAAEDPARALPIGAVLHRHLWRAEPLKSIQDPNYFIDAVDAADRDWRAACDRRRTLAVALANADVKVFDSVQLDKINAPFEKPPAYVPHRQTFYVQNASPVATFDVHDEIDDATAG